MEEHLLNTSVCDFVTHLRLCYLVLLEGQKWGSTSGT